jgi:glutathione synthase/RimK-type ligase-like ATP-grasp enzyme
MLWLPRPRPESFPVPFPSLRRRPSFRRLRDERLDVLLLDADYRQTLTAARCYARAGLRVGVLEGDLGRRPLTFASRHPVRRFTVPDYHDDPAAYAEGVLRVLEEVRVDVVLPVSDPAIEALAPHRARIAATGARLALASPRAIELANDKASTLRIAAEAGVPVPQGIQVHDEAELLAAGRRLGLPAVVKPVRSWAPGSTTLGRLASTLVADEAELREVGSLLLRAEANPLVQQWLPGVREGIHVFYSGGTFSARMALVELRTSPPLGGNAVLRETVPLPEDTVKHAETLVRALGLEGYCVVEFRRDADGVPRLMEVNARVPASMELAVHAGIDFPSMLRDWARGRPVRPADGYRTGVRMRWLGGDVRWLRSVLASDGHHPDVPPRGRAVAVFLRDFLRPTRYDCVDARDPRPMLLAVRLFLAATSNELSGRNRAKRTAAEDELRRSAA